MVEVWKPIVNYVGLYEVSDAGRIRRVVGGRGARANRILSGSPTADGYVAVGLSKDGIRRSHLIHTLVLAAFIGPCTDGQEGDHKNKKRDDNRLKNLRYKTHRENVRESAKMTPKSVLSLRKDWATGAFSQRQLAEKYGIGMSGVGHIVNNRIWKDVG